MQKHLKNGTAEPFEKGEKSKTHEFDAERLLLIWVDKYKFFRRQMHQFDWMHSADLDFVSSLSSLKQLWQSAGSQDNKHSSFQCAINN